MTSLYTQTPLFFSDICEEMRLYIDTRRIEQLNELLPPDEGICVIHEMSESGGMFSSRAALYRDGKLVSENTYECSAPPGELEHKRAAKRSAKISVYRALLSYFGTVMPWGSLTGVRPTKLLRDSEALLGEEGAKRLLLNEFDVSPGKYDFAKGILTMQAGLKPRSDELDVYIGIPFCVSRCAYCSFASFTPNVFKGAEEQYVRALMEELQDAEALTGGRRVRALYVGGGTPTALSEQHLATVLQRAAELARGADEFTVEAGRPDTITAEKLRIIKDSGAGRISVNAQTLCDETLARIGRRHTAREFFDAYSLAASYGFDINVDVIAGLPGEDADRLMETLHSIIELAPANITVHTLAVKRASAFAAANMEALPTDAATAEAVEQARQTLEQAGYRAYYMYRQKYMKGSLENAGYTRPGKACLYNIDNMEELCDVLAFGAGAISKRIFFDEARIERAANIKDLRMYLERLGDVMERKRALFL
ncbi:MAG: coproporphyrinogen dehydrogenase HemZ [Christensenellales bacterium]|jgi:coproporphyrinogen dehydrogenase HemZ